MVDYGVDILEHYEMQQTDEDDDVLWVDEKLFLYIDVEWHNELLN